MAGWSDNIECIRIVSAHDFLPRKELRQDYYTGMPYQFCNLPESQFSPHELGGAADLRLQDFHQEVSSLLKPAILLEIVFRVIPVHACHDMRYCHYPNRPSAAFGLHLVRAVGIVGINALYENLINAGCNFGCQSSRPNVFQNRAFPVLLPNHSGRCQRVAVIAGVKILVVVVPAAVRVALTANIGNKCAAVVRQVIQARDALE